MSGAAVLCDDVMWPTSVSQYRSELATDEQKFPLFGPLGSQIWACAFWHFPPIERPVTLTSNGPPQSILLLQNLRDPVTPLPGATRMHEVLGDRSRLVLVDGGGHGIIAIGDNICAAQTFSDYMANGTLPQDGTTCPANPPSSSAQGVSAERQQMIRAARRQMTPFPH
jgi:hypothetical protein